MEKEPTFLAAGAGEDFQSVIVDTIMEGVSVADEAGMVVYTNSAEDQMFGYERGELLGKHVTVFNAYEEEENHRQMQNVISHLLAEGKWEGEFFNRKKDGTTFYTAARIVRVSRDEKQYFICVQRDITAQKAKLEASLRRDDALRHSEERLRLALQAGAMGIWDWDVLTDTLTWSERTFEIHGMSREQFGGRAESFFETVYQHDRLELTRKFEAALAEGEAYSGDFRIVRPDGTVRWVCNLAKIVRDESGRPVRIVGTITDITDRKQIEDALQLASERKDEFLAMLAHELRNPLAPISAAAQLLESGGQDTKRQQAVSRVIGRQVKHMVELVDDLLDVSRVTRGLVQISNDVQAIKSIVSTAVEQVTPAIEASRHSLIVEMTGEEAYVLGDRKRLVQVLTNLLGNSAKYTADGGNIRLTVEVNEEQVILNVDDDGQGIEPDMQEDIFELFAQVRRTSDRSQGGLGIGLALVKSLVELHRGTVRCISRGLGHGSRFQVKLPLVAKEYGTGGVSEQEIAKTQRSLRILVADDHVDAGSMLAMLLEEAGHHVAVEHTSNGALERARVEVPHVCLLDIGLPEMDGYELARRLRGLPDTSNCVLIAITGYGQENDRAKALSAGFDHHFTKPVNTEELAAVLSKIE